MGLLRSLATPTIEQPVPVPVPASVPPPPEIAPRPTVSTGSTQTRPTASTGSTQTIPTASTGSTQTEQTIFRAPTSIYDPRNISDDESSSISSLPNFSRFLSDDESSSISAPSISSLDRRPETSVRELMNLMAGKGQFYAYGNNLHYDPYNPDESMEDRFTDRLPRNQTSFFTTEEQDNEEEPAPIIEEKQDDEKKQEEEPDDEEEEPANKTFAMEVYEEIAKAVPGISVENAGQMLASEEGVTAKEVHEFYKGKQSIITTARGQGKKHGKSGSEMKGDYAKMPDYKNSYLVGKGEYDGSRLVTFDPRYENEAAYQRSFNKAYIKTRIEDTKDTEAGVNFDRQARNEDRAARNEDRGEGFTLNKFSKNLFRDSKKI